MKDLIRYLRIYIIRIVALLRTFHLVLGERVLIIAPHPDDEVIGCAGLIQQCLSNKKQVFVCILTGGEGSHRGCCTISAEELKANRRQLAARIDKEIGLPEENLFMLEFPDGGISSECQECSRLKDLFFQVNPDCVFIPHQKGEGWPDHIEAGNIVKQIAQGTNITLYEYCVWFWYYNVWDLDWKNARVVRMSKLEHNVKLQSISDYITPLAPCGKPYSGVLPKVFIKANQWNKELFFKL